MVVDGGGGGEYSGVCKARSYPGQQSIACDLVTHLCGDMGTAELYPTPKPLPPLLLGLRARTDPDLLSSRTEAKHKRELRSMSGRVPRLPALHTNLAVPWGQRACVGWGGWGRERGRVNQSQHMVQTTYDSSGFSVTSAHISPTSTRLVVAGGRVEGPVWELLVLPAAMATGT